MSLIFYDLETSGIAKGFDQILQFAAARTDDDLQPLGEPFEVRSRLLPHVIPAPSALRVTGMTIEALLDPARPSHYEMVCRVREVVGGWCPGVFVGYNSLRFDEEFLRQAFYQCLQPPYLTNTGGSGRADALRLMRAVALVDPQALTVPLGDNGKPSFKLDRLAPANGFDHLNAHDALADVEAMIGLCRLARDRRPDLWAAFRAMAHKAAVIDFLDEHRAFLTLEGAGAQGTAVPVVRLGCHPQQPTLTYALDLRCDHEVLRDLNDEDLSARVGRSPRVIRKIKSNGAPILLGLDEATPRLLGGLEPSEARRRADQVLANADFVARLVAAAAAHETVYDPSPHVEQQLYGGGFWSREDERLMAEFHRLPWERRLDLVAQFSDRRLRLLARRLIYFERPDLMAPAERERHAAAIRQRTLTEPDETPPWLTAQRALQEIEDLLATEIAVVARELLEGYRGHLRRRLDQPALT